jgi:3-phosphoglycerate kinase
MIQKPPYYISSRIHEITSHAHVLLRADLNVSIAHDGLIDDFRLNALKPTLNALQQNHAHTLIVTHRAQPTSPDPSLSTKHLVSWFTRNNYDCVYADTIAHAHQKLPHHRFVLLENIRFWPEEKTQDTTFAHTLKGTTTRYVMDAFATSHRSDTSITTLATCYEKESRTIGLLTEHELSSLNHLISKPNKPFALLIGGAKMATKLPLISHMLSKIDIIALLPPLSLLFETHDTHNAHDVPPALLNQARTIAHQAKGRLLLPKDYLVASSWKDSDTYVFRETITPGKKALSIGPKTIDLYYNTLRSAHTLFLNGASGDIQYPLTCEPIKTLIESLCTTPSFKVCAGGDTVAMIHALNLTSCFNVLSTGGGATLAYLSGEPLPGLIPYM